MGWNFRPAPWRSSRVCPSLRSLAVDFCVPLGRAPKVRGVSSSSPEVRRWPPRSSSSGCGAGRGGSVADEPATLPPWSTAISDGPVMAAAAPPMLGPGASGGPAAPAPVAGAGPTDEPVAPLTPPPRGASVPAARAARAALAASVCRVPHLGALRACQICYILRWQYATHPACDRQGPQ